MRVRKAWFLISGVAVVALAAAGGRLAAQHGLRPADLPQAPQSFAATPADASQQPAQIAIGYPEEGSIFPPEITAPTFIWHDPAATAAAWRIDVSFADGSAGLQFRSRGERLPIGEIDPRCIAETNELPKLTPREAVARSWKPDVETWGTIKLHAVNRPATVTITGFRDDQASPAVSRGQVTIRTSKDPVGAPIFYRDVPLMPTETEKGIIKPIVPSAVPFIGWRLRNIGESRSRLLMEDLPTCANCHSFSLDGKTMGMDVDGPQNDRGMYTIIPVTPRISIRSEDVFTWNDIPQNGLQKMDVPAAEFYRLMDSAWKLAENRQYDAAILDLNKALALSPKNAKAHNNLGRALAEKGELDAAILQWQQALEADSRYAEARNNLGVGLIRKARLDEAIAQFRMILEINGEYAEVHNNLGRALDQKGKLDQAVAEWNKALQINPGYAEVHNNLGTGLSRKGRLNEAIDHWQEAIRLTPGFGQAHFNLGNAFYSQGKTAAALEQWREGLRNEPSRQSALNQTARVLATCPEASLRSGAEAVELARRAIRLSSGQDPAFLDTLAAACAEAGRFPEAVQTARQALSVAQQQSRQRLAEDLKARIALYESGTPYRELR